MRFRKAADYYGIDAGRAPGARLGLVSALALIVAGCSNGSSVNTFFEVPDYSVAQPVEEIVDRIADDGGEVVDDVIATVLETVLSTAPEAQANAAIQAAGIAAAYDYVSPATGLSDPLTGAGSIIAIMSDGVDGTHPEIAGKIVGGYNTAEDSDLFAPTVRHLCVARINPAVNDCDPGTYGTEMAGVIAGRQDGQGMQGVAPNARIFAINATDEANDFGINGDANATAYDRALAAGAKVIVHGYGKGVDYTREDEMKDPANALVTQLVRTAAQGVVHVYGAGSVKANIWDMPDWENNGRPNLEGDLPIWHNALRNGALILATTGYSSGRLSRGGMSEDTELALLNWLTDPTVDGAEHARRRAAVDGVVAVDADGVETLDDYDRDLFAMAGDAAWCKGAAMWCLVVTPSNYNIVASDGQGTSHQAEDEDQDGYAGGWTHGNNAAAVVAGAMTLLKEAFPYLSEQQIATILLDSAEYLPPDSPGIIEYTVNGVTANEKFGRGLLDVEAALQPAGPVAFAIGDSLATATTVPVSSSSASFAGVLSGAAAAFDRPLVYFDSYGRAFPVDVAALTSESGGFEDGLDRLSRVLGLTGGMLAMAPADFGGGLGKARDGREALAARDWHGGYGGEASFRLGKGTLTMGFSPTGAVTGAADAAALLGRGRAEPFSSGHLSFVENEAAASLAGKTGWGATVSFGAGLSSDPDDESTIVAHRFATDYAQPLGENSALGLRAGYLGRTDGTLFGTESRGAFALADTVETAFFEATLTHRLTDRLALVGQAQWGRSWVESPETALARLDGPLDTGALRFGIDATSALVDGDRLSLGAGTALHTIAGTARLDYATGRDAAGTILTETHRIDLASGRPPLELRLDYAAPLGASTDIGITAALRDEANRDLQGDIFVGLATRF